MMKRLLLSFIFLGVLSLSCQNNQPNIKGVFAEDGAWCWFQDPRAVYIKGKQERTYAQWVSKEGKLIIGAYNHASKEKEFFTLKRRWGHDDHNVGAFVVLPDHRLMVFFTRHNRDGVFCRTSSEPENISKWEKEITITNMKRVTYVHPVYLKKEQRLYVFWRGENWKPTFSTSLNGIEWTPHQVFVQNKPNPKVRPYIKVIDDGISSIHFAFTDGHPNEDSDNSINYVKYKNDIFVNSKGDTIGNIRSLPLQISDCSVVYNGKNSNKPAWIWDIALDEIGDPIIAYAQFPSDSTHIYHYAYWNGEKWVNNKIAKSGRWFPKAKKGEQETEKYYSGGMALNQNKPSIIYISKQEKEIFEIEKCTTIDKGKTWKFLPITTKSSDNNVRPVYPRGYKGREEHILWMNGAYRHYLDFQTSIRIIDTVELKLPNPNNLIQ